MKKVKIWIPIVAGILLVGIASCKKEETQVDLTKDVVGTYQGKLTNSSTNMEVAATSKVTYYNDYTVKVNCFGGDFDTTFLLELYPDGSMMKVCATGDDFYNEYGHQKPDHDHMMGGDTPMDWNDHMSQDHDTGDEHYGDFDPNANKFEYTMKIEHPINAYTQHFIGNK